MLFALLTNILTGAAHLTLFVGSLLTVFIPL
jgi:hypothetical protein